MGDDSDGADAARAARRRGREPPKRTYPWAACLFATAVVLQPLSRNLGQATFADAVPALIGSLVFALLVYLIVAVLRRHFDTATAVIACWWVVGGLYAGLLIPGNDGATHTSLLFLTTLLFILTVVFHRLHRLGDLAHRLLIGIAFALVAFPLWHLLAHEWQHGDADAAYDADRAAAAMPQVAGPAPLDPDGTDRPPDIYHFIFDTYASADILASHYGIDNPIIEFLEARGFYVAHASHSNYHKTGHSLASTFYMDYIDFFEKDPRAQGANWHPIFAMLKDHRVLRFLNTRGYEILQFGSWWRGTFENPFADENRPLGFSEFNMIFLGGTLLRPLFTVLPELPLASRLRWDRGQCQRVARQIERIKAIGSGPKPIYLFAHILVPHGPYVFTPDGDCLSYEESVRRGPQRGYVEQVAYANTIIEDIVTALQADDRRPSVILIQADEGPMPERNHSTPWQQASAEELRIKTGILNAYHFPNGDYSELRPDITPVNSYRAVFNTIFGTDFPQLPDRIFAFPGDWNIYEFHDVTERVRCGKNGTMVVEPGARTSGNCRNSSQ